MDNKDHRLQPAVQVARAREDEAAQALADFQRRLIQRQTRLQQLLDFRNEYTEQFHSAGQGGISARRFQDYIGFLSKLDQSIVQCRQNLELLRKEFQRKRRLWMTSHAKTQALEGVIQRDLQQQSHAEERREQAESDERNLRSHGPLA